MIEILGPTLIIFVILICVAVGSLFLLATIGV